jgi:hypothetical protein
MRIYGVRSQRRKFVFQDGEVGSWYIVGTPAWSPDLDTSSQASPLASASPALATSPTSTTHSVSYLATGGASSRSCWADQLKTGSSCGRDTPPVHQTASGGLVGRAPRIPPTGMGPETGVRSGGEDCSLVAGTGLMPERGKFIFFFFDWMIHFH